MGDEDCEPKKRRAAEAARSWLDLVDEARYGQSWEAAAPMFKQAVSQEQWVQQVSAVRDPLGPVLMRQLSSGSCLSELPNAPKGDYVILSFDPNFRQGGDLNEQVTPVLTPDGYKVTGYFVRPGN